MTADQRKKLKEALSLCQSGKSYPACKLIWAILEESENNPFTDHWRADE